MFKIPDMPPVAASETRMRPYQAEALDALDDHMRNKPTNPCVVIPTGGGKSLLIAWAIQRWKGAFPPFRCIILAHRKELVQQNAEEMRGLWPGGDVGVYAAGLHQRDIDASVVFASIDSVYDKWGDFPPFNVVIVDEAHRIPAKGEGKYRSFVKGCQSVNKKVRVIGFTATPFRLGLGPVCHRDHVLNEVCYEANIGALIADGYLCRLRSKVGAAVPDLSDVRRNGKGDYVESSLAQVMEVPDVVREAVREAMGAIQAEGRKSVVFFCVDVKHCHAVALELRRYGLHAPVVTANTPAHERDRIAEDFKQGRHRAICNVNVYTEGFNAKRVDCVVLLRPTLSAGLFAQMVGRGLRVHPSKQDCLVLDFARCIETHGPVDCLSAGEVRVIVCGSVKPPTDADGEPLEWRPGCGDTFSRVLGVCPHCGWVIPPHEVRREAAEREKDAERQLHEKEASQRAIIGAEPETLKVDSVKLNLHRKAGSPDSVCVQYRCGLATFREWVCLDHEGFAGKKARAWWALRFGLAARKVNVASAVGDLFTTKWLEDITESITVVRRGKHYDVIGHKLRSSNYRYPEAMAE